jgi:signal transduction histidine kinase/DNA-binding response OmpR family regulator/streptogramin lyase
MAGGLAAQEYRFQFHGLEQGLTNLAIKSIYQDRTGFIWVSTENGIFRYDGERFQSFGSDQGIPSSSGAAFGEAPDGALLVGGDKGLFRMVGSHFEKLPLPGEPLVTWMGGLKSDTRGKTYIATNNGLMVLTEDLSTGRFSIRQLVGPSAVTGPATRGILVENDSVWYGCGQELCRSSGGQPIVYNSQSGLPPAAWMPIGRAANGDLWVRGNGVGVAVLANGASQFQRLSAPLPTSGLSGMPSVDSEGRILFPSPDGLVIRRNDSWWKIGRAEGLRGVVYCVMQDREGSLWIGLAGKGLARWAGYGEWEAYTTDSGLGSDLVYQILSRSDGTVWAGTESGLVHGTRHGAAFTWRREPAIGNTPVHSVRSGSDGMLWIGTETRGVARLNPSTGAVTWIGAAQGLDAKSPYALTFDHSRRIWAATENGLFVADLPFHRFRRIEEIPRARFWAVAEAANGDVWAGGSRGLFHLAGTAWDRFTTRESLSNDEVLSLGTARNGDVWVGYRFGGEIDRLSSVNGKIVISHATRRSAGGLVYFLGFDARERLWAGTERGVDVLEEGRWTHLDTNDGLVWDDCDLNGFAAEPDGTVWIGTSGGLARFSPRPQKATIYRSAVIFTRLTLGGKEASPADLPSVGYRSNELVARFSALSFGHANMLSFRYRLSPLFTEWRTIDRTELEFPGLPAGSYRLEVQVRDQWGTWSADAAAFRFDIQSPWFYSWWFIGICIAAPLLLVAFGIKLRMAVLQRREKELIELVRERTFDLNESRDAAEAASRGTSNFLATMSHEIRTPLNGVIGMTGILLDTALTAEQKEYVSTVQSSGEALLVIINDVLDFSKIEAGKLELEEIDFELFTMIEECIEIVATGAHRKGLELILPVPSGTQTLVRGDPNRVRQILLNLLSNAIKFTAEGEVAVTVEIQAPVEGVPESSNDAELVRFEVRDTGAGISKETQARLFHAFSQADSSTTRKFGGTGLGLTISRRLVKLMGGEIGVISEPGKGSTFWFTARLGKPLNPVPLQPVLTGMRILVVEDNAANRQVLELQLERNGCTVQTVAGAPQALAALEASRRSGRAFDAILADLRMPEIDGMMLLKSIRALPDFQGIIPVLIMASHADRETVPNNAVDGFLLKPVKESHLVRALHKLFSPEGSEQIAHETAPQVGGVTLSGRGKILLAEDNLVNQKVAALTLRNLGYEVDIVANGREALAALDEHPYILVLMDCQMPEMDGFEATRAIRAHGAGSNKIPIIALTANALPGEREKCLAAGMNGYLTKPFNRDVLTKILDEWAPVSSGLPE